MRQPKNPRQINIKTVVMNQTVEDSKGFYVRIFNEDGGYTETFTPHKKDEDEDKTTNNN